MIAAIPSLAGALSSATSMRGLHEEIAAVRTIFMPRGPLLKQIAWICQYQLLGNVKRGPVGHENEKGRNTLNIARVPPHFAAICQDHTAGDFFRLT